MNIVGRRKLWFSLSLLVIIPGLISLIVWGLPLGIDFKGGQEIEISTSKSQSDVRAIVERAPVKDVTVTSSGAGRLLIRYTDADNKESDKNHQLIKQKLAEEGATEISFDSIGPAVSRDIARNAIVSIILASIAIMLYIAFAFRNTPPPVSPLSFGTTAVIALLHDALLVLGVFSLLGHFAGIEIDSLFVTAVLTVIGFSVHDTIVVYDRVRENLRKHNKPFEEVVNMSILETFTRSVNTSLTVFITLLALFIFGGSSIRVFVFALLIGVISGTYSSIFNAAPLLVVYNNWKIKKTNKK